MRGRGGAFIFLLRVRGAFFFCCGCALARGSAGQAESNGASAGQPGGTFIFLLRVRGAFFFLLWVRGRFAHSLAAGAGLGNPIGHGLRIGACAGPGGGGGGAFIFLLRVRGAFFFLLWVRGRFAHSLAAGAGLGNPIGHGLRIGACAGPGGGGAFIFLLRVRGAFFFLLWVRPCPGLGRSGGMQWGVGRPAGGRVYFFAAGARRVFFCCGCAAGSLTHLLPAASEHPLQKGIQGPWRVFFFAAGARALGGGRVYFFCCGCAARLFFAAGARAHSLTHSLAARRPESTNSKKAHTTKKKHGFQP